VIAGTAASAAAPLLRGVHRGGDLGELLAALPCVARAAGAVQPPQQAVLVAQHQVRQALAQVRRRGARVRRLHPEARVGRRRGGGGAHHGDVAHDRTATRAELGRGRMLAWAITAIPIAATVATYGELTVQAFVAVLLAGGALTVAALRRRAGSGSTVPGGPGLAGVARGGRGVGVLHAAPRGACRR
jgi:hypothetical protein